MSEHPKRGVESDGHRSAGMRWRALMNSDSIFICEMSIFVRNLAWEDHDNGNVALKSYEQLGHSAMIVSETGEENEKLSLWTHQTAVHASWQRTQWLNHRWHKGPDPFEPLCRSDDGRWGSQRRQINYWTARQKYRKIRTVRIAKATGKRHWAVEEIDLNSLGVHGIPSHRKLSSIEIALSLLLYG